MIASIITLASLVLLVILGTGGLMLAYGYQEERNFFLIALASCFIGSAGYMVAQSGMISMIAMVCGLYANLFGLNVASLDCSKGVVKGIFAISFALCCICAMSSQFPN